MLTLFDECEADLYLMLGLGSATPLPSSTTTTTTITTTTTSNSASATATKDVATDPVDPHPLAVEYYATPTSGGKSNNISVLPQKGPQIMPSVDSEWIALGDDAEGLVVILEWSRERRSVRELARVGLPGGKDPRGESVGGSASQVVWYF